MKKIEPMNTPKTRKEFEHRFHLLHERIHSGKMHFAKGTADGVLKVRFLPNGRIDFLSVDESARLQANMTLQFDSSQIEELIKKSENTDSKTD